MASRDVPVQHRLVLDPVPENARTARALVTRALSESGRDDLVESAALLVSELVTNAIVHARTAISVEVTATGHGVHVGVNDQNQTLPARRGYGAQATTGRGLEMVDLIATRHGTEVLDDGSKTVWFELGTVEAELADAAIAASGSGAVALTARSVTVSWLHMPMRLGRSWQQHADAMLREYLLLAWEGGGADPRLAEQARASEAFAAVAVPLDAAPPARTGASRADLVVDVAPAVAEGFAVLDRLLEEITDLSEREETLTPPTQPEMRMLRRWICGEATRQAEGEPPQPWPGLDPGTRPARPRPLVYDVSAVDDARTPMLAADDTNRIIAASPSALALLGWADGSLVGRRIVSVVPERYREDHIAAFTDHLLSGATTILDRVVRVPALRADGSEVEVDLLVRSERAGGRTVFLASLTPVR